MDVSTAVKDIRSINNEGKLVIFVGSGVSANSSVPTWGELIKIFAKELEYDKCDYCPNKSESCQKSECKLRYNFSSDEYLKISEYYYNKYPDKYKEILKNKLKSEKPPNSIDHIIFKILPHHIITTNFDTLLEDTNEPNRSLYSVITKDNDLLKQNKNRYIIKMHGDIKNLDEIVLRERDYIEYEQTHPIISTYIRSLLIDHTFLFIGYSLNDYNLKLIMGWVNYFVRESNVSNCERPKNYIIQCSENSLQNFEIDYYEKNNLYIINSCELPTSLVNSHKIYDLDDDRSKSLYSCLNYILDDTNDYKIQSLEEILYDRYKVLDIYNRISIEDLISVSKFKGCEVKGSTLYFWNNDQYKKITEIIKSNSEKSKYIINIFRKSGIDSINLINDLIRDPINPVNLIKFLPTTSYYNISLPDYNTNREKRDDKLLFSLYLENRYNELKKHLSDDNYLPNIKLFYYYLFASHSKECVIEIEKISKTFTSEEYYVNLLFYKINHYYLLLNNALFYKNNEFSFIQNNFEIKAIAETIPNNLKSSTLFLKKLCIHDMSNIQKSFSLLAEHENMYRNISLNFFDGYYGKLLEMQSIAYDYYFYFKLNYLLLEYSENRERYFEPYLKAILCTYRPEKDMRQGNISNSLTPLLSCYELSSIDVDLFTKYTNGEHLESWFKNYNVNLLSYKNDVHLIRKFKNICESFSTFVNRRNLLKIYSFSILLSHTSLSYKEKSDVIKALVSLTKSYYDNNNFNAILLLFPAIIRLLNIYKSRLWYPLLSILINKDIIDLVNENGKQTLYYDEIISLLLPYSDEKITSKINKLFESSSKENIVKYIYYLRKLITDDKWKNYLQNNIDSIGDLELLVLINDGFINYSDDIGKRFLKSIQQFVSNQKENPNVHSYQNQINRSINNYIILYITGKATDITLLKQYAEYSPVLEFLLNPDKFDYKKFYVDYFMWQNIIQNDKYLPELKKHKTEIFTDDLKYRYKNNMLSHDLMKLIFTKLLDCDDEWI